MNWGIFTPIVLIVYAPIFVCKWIKERVIKGNKNWNKVSAKG